MSISLIAIVAMTPERIIGHAGALPWHLPEDLAFFKKTTSGFPIIMGRKTFDSIGRALPKRRNIVLTRDENWSAEDVEVIHSPEELFALAELGKQAFIIGGSEVYKAFMDLTDEMIVSHVTHDYPGDTIFPEFEQVFPVSEDLASFDGFRVKHYKRK